MESEQANPGHEESNESLRLCRGRQTQALSDAKELGFEREFEQGIYSRSQLSQWAGEQWLVWLEAAAEDRRAAEETEDSEARMVPVRVRNPHRP
jgi:hypothetical protein